MAIKFEPKPIPAIHLLTEWIEADKGHLSNSFAAEEAGLLRNRLRIGRPLASQAHLTLSAMKPWLALGMSRRTWYRRRKAHPLGGSHE